MGVVVPLAVLLLPAPTRVAGCGGPSPVGVTPMGAANHAFINSAPRAHKTPNCKAHGGWPHCGSLPWLAVQRSPWVRVRPGAQACPHLCGRGLLPTLPPHHTTLREPPSCLALVAQDACTDHGLGQFWGGWREHTKGKHTHNTTLFPPPSLSLYHTPNPLSHIPTFHLKIILSTMSNIRGLYDDKQDDEKDSNNRYVGGIGSQGGGRFVNV